MLCDDAVTDFRPPYSRGLSDINLPTGAGQFSRACLDIDQRSVSHAPISSSATGGRFEFAPRFDFIAFVDRHLSHLHGLHNAPAYAVHAGGADAGFSARLRPGSLCGRQ